MSQLKGQTLPMSQLKDQTLQVLKNSLVGSGEQLNDLGSKDVFKTCIYRF